jgi:TusA-related sulfurtransferase
MKPAEVLNLEGVACPQNSARALLKLEGMKIDDILEIIVDEGEPIKNVPISLKTEEHEIISKVKVNKTWKILVRKL